MDKNAAIISGTIEFDRFAGDSDTTTDVNSNESEEALTQFSFLPAFDYFVARNVFIGATLRYSSRSIGNHSSSTLGIGPDFGYAAGRAENGVYPFAKAAFLFTSESVTFDHETNKTTGSDIATTLGLIAPVKNHIGIIPQLSYHFLSTKGDWGGAERMKDNQLSFGVGVSGLLY